MLLVMSIMYNYRYESSRILYMENVNILIPNIYTVVASSQCRYLKPVFYPDVLKVGVRVEEIRNSAFRMAYIYGVKHSSKSLRRVKP